MRVGTYKTILSVLTALTVVLGMRMMGAMLLSSLIIFPALSAMRVFKSFRSVVCFAAGLSVMCFCLGLTGSYLLSTPVGATVVVCDLAAFLLCCLIAAGLGMTHFLNFLKGAAANLQSTAFPCYVVDSPLLCFVRKI